MKKILPRILTLILIVVLAGCAQLSKQAESIKPAVNLTNVRLASINFERADLVFDFEIDNENPVPLRLSSLNYDLKIEDQSLVSGVADKNLQIRANSISTVELSVSLKFDDLKKLPGELKDRDRITYKLDTQIMVDIPLIGVQAIPVSKQGELPVPKLPGIKLKDVKLDKLGSTHADVVAQIEIDNPNAFDLAISNLEYQLNINQQTLGQGKISWISRIPKKDKGTIDIPFKLDLLSMGQAAYALLSQKQAFEYRLTGSVTLDTGLELLRNVNMPLDIEGNSVLK